MMADTISRQAAIDALAEHEKSNGHNYTLFVDIVSECAEIIRDLPSAQPEITDAQAIDHLQATGWMQNHDHEMYMMGIRDGLADDGGSYDALIQPEQKVGKWTYHSNPSFGINPEDAYCSRCGFHVYVVDVEFDDYKYCPNCGVKMEERDEVN